MKHLAAIQASVIEPVALIEARMVQRVLRELVVHRRIDLDCDSPIEEMFFLALAVELAFDEPRLETLPSGSSFVEPFASTSLYVEKQAQAFGWRVDFLFHRNRRQLVVECDGHEFHERTKSQAARDRARDRAVQDGGASIYRFTGSELWRDPVKCALQVVDWARKAEAPR